MSQGAFTVTLWEGDGSAASIVRRRCSRAVQMWSGGKSAMQSRTPESGILPASPTRRIARAMSAPSSSSSPPRQSDVPVHTVAASTTPYTSVRPSVCCRTRMLYSSVS